MVTVAHAQMTLRELVESAGISARVAGENPVITGIVEDSRGAHPGCLFLARPGTKTDGRKFIGDAIGAGAVAVGVPAGEAAPTGVPTIVLADPARDIARLAEAFYGWPSRGMKVFGVTGTNGKTTTALLVQQLLGFAGVRSGLVSTVHIDDGREIATARLTTPSSVELAQAFARMRDNGCACAAMEVSSHALDQGRAGALRFRVAAFTNLSGDHLDYHGTMERYAAAKAVLFEGLDRDAVAIVNADDPAHEVMVRRCAARVVRVSLGGPGRARADVTATIEESSIRGVRARIAGVWGEHVVRSPLIGVHNLWNLTIAISAAIELGVSPQVCMEAASGVRPPPGRLEPVHAQGLPPENDQFYVFVDYAHTDDALSRVLSAVRPLLPHDRARVRVLFGCGGDRDRTKRPRMAAAACAGADTVIVTSDNPRTEDPRAIIADVVAGIPAEAKGRVGVEPDRRAAIGKLIASAGPGDILVLAGKGHETYQLLPDGKGGIIRRDFDDRAVAAEALASRWKRVESV